MKTILAFFFVFGIWVNTQDLKEILTEPILGPSVT